MSSCSGFSILCGFLVFGTAADSDGRLTLSVSGTMYSSSSVVAIIHTQDLVNTHL